MALKKLLPLMIITIFTFNINANEVQEDNTVKDCETVYTTCEDKCMSDENVNKESCLEKCDLLYEKCLEQSPAQ